jgi:acyl-CoA synthetase (AMP-forming)/AMP-acid ligase II
MLLLGAAANLYTVSPISPMLMPAELAKILAKARPQVLVTLTGPDGEEKLRKGLQILLDQPETDIASVSGKEVKRWAHELASSWDRGKKQKHQKGDRQPIHEQRVWTVNLSTSGGADYYGTNSRGDGISALSDPRDWSNLLHPPQGHKHAGSVDLLGREAALVRKVTKEEQTRRVFLLLWSSGTTGESKGVLLSHRNLVASLQCSWYSHPQVFGPSRGPFSGGETWIALAPWCHVMG